MISAYEAWQAGYAGFELVGIEPDWVEYDDRYIYHFPDGNAGVARLLVRALVPAVASGQTMEDVVDARFDYSKLDRPDHAVRIRLNSTVVNVSHRDRGEDLDAEEVDIVYVREGKAQRVRASQVVMACWHSVIPHICPEIPASQKQALAYAVKPPLVYANVFIRDWKAFHELGVSSVSCPGSFFHGVSLDFPVSLGGYKHPRSPDESMVLHLTHTPTSPGAAPKDQFRAGRYQMLAMSFDDFERRIRDQLQRVLSAGGFDAARDIEAVTVNRWPHGYAYEYAYVGEPDWTEETKPCHVARKRFGRIAIANADAGGLAYAHVAIDQGYRAVADLSGMRTTSTEAPLRK